MQNETHFITIFCWTFTFWKCLTEFNLWWQEMYEKKVISFREFHFLSKVPLYYECKLSDFLITKIFLTNSQLKRISLILNFLPLPSSASFKDKCLIIRSLLNFDVFPRLNLMFSFVQLQTTIVWVIQSSLWVMSFFKILKINVGSS